MRSRIPGVVLVLTGAGLASITLTQHTFGAAAPFAKVVHDVRPVIAPSTTTQMRTDITTVQAGVAGLSDQALPALAASTEQTPAQLQAKIAKNYPAVAIGLQQLPAITAGFSGFADLLDAQRSNFNAAAAIPVADVTPKTVPPALLATAAVMVLLGLVLTIRPRSRRTAAAGVLAGGLLLAACFTASLPQKADASAELKAALGPVVTAQAVAADRAALATLSAMAAQLQQKMLPDTAVALHVTPTFLVSQMAASSPALGSLFAELPAIQARFTALVDTLAQEVQPWRSASKPSFVVLVRTLLATALVSLLAGVGALVLGHRGSSAALRVTARQHQSAGPVVRRVAAGLPKQASAPLAESYGADQSQEA